MIKKHPERHKYTFKVLQTGLTLQQARALEQGIILSYGGVANLDNIINGISQNKYDAFIDSIEILNKLELSYIEDEVYNGINIGHGVFGGW